MKLGQEPSPRSEISGKESIQYTNASALRS
jgi:hypothetical protein